MSIVSFFRSPRLSFLFLRFGLGIVFLVFGIGKFRGDEWAMTMHSMAFFTYLPWSVDVSVLLAGILEVTTGTCLILGLGTRLFAFLAAGELISILLLLYFQGITETRDIGLLAMALALTLRHEEVLNADVIFKKIFFR